jgi:hypothetical protein
VRGGAIYNDGGRDIPGYSGLGARASAQYVGKITDNLGVVVSGTYQRQKNGFESFQGWGYNTIDTGSPPTDAQGNRINTRGAHRPKSRAWPRPAGAPAARCNGSRAPTGT